MAAVDGVVTWVITQMRQMQNVMMMMMTVFLQMLIVLTKLHPLLNGFVEKKRVLGMCCKPL